MKFHLVISNLLLYSIIHQCVAQNGYQYNRPGVQLPSPNVDTRLNENKNGFGVKNGKPSSPQDGYQYKQPSFVNSQNVNKNGNAGVPGSTFTNGYQYNKPSNNLFSSTPSSLGNVPTSFSTPFYMPSVTTVKPQQPNVFRPNINVDMNVKPEGFGPTDNAQRPYNMFPNTNVANNNAFSSNIGGGQGPSGIGPSGSYPSSLGLQAPNSYNVGITGNTNPNNVYGSPPVSQPPTAFNIGGTSPNTAFGGTTGSLGSNTFNAGNSPNFRGSGLSQDTSGLFAPSSTPATFFGAPAGSQGLSNYNVDTAGNIGPSPTNNILPQGRSGFNDGTSNTLGTNVFRPPVGASDDDGRYDAGDYSAIPGKPDVDYPIYSTIPQTKFSCSTQNYPGYFADVEARCQVFHVCYNGIKYDFLCPNGTIFHQQYFVCVWWNQFDCNTAERLYGLNENIYSQTSLSARTNIGEGPVLNQQGPATKFGGISGPQVSIANIPGVSGPQGIAANYPGITGPQGPTMNYPNLAGPQGPSISYPAGITTQGPFASYPGSVTPQGPTVSYPKPAGTYQTSQGPGFPGSGLSTNYQPGLSGSGNTGQRGTPATFQRPTASPSLITTGYPVTSTVGSYDTVPNVRLFSSDVQTVTPGQYPTQSYPGSLIDAEPGKSVTEITTAYPDTFTETTFTPYTYGAPSQFSGYETESPLNSNSRTVPSGSLFSPDFKQAAPDRSYLPPYKKR